VALQTIHTFGDRRLTRRIKSPYPYSSVRVKLAEVRKVSFKKEPTPTTNHPDVEAVRNRRRRGRGRDRGRESR
jgi:hypothetical protein